MSRLIAEMDLYTLAHTATVVALVRTGANSSETRQHLHEQMDRLKALRQEQMIGRVGQMQPRTRS